jgi:ribosomal protein S18 acetylase RimI-like enzyme
VRAEDEAVLFALYRAVRAQELQLEHLAPALLAQLLRSQFEAQRRSYREQYPAADERLIVRDGAPIGWVIVDRSGADLHGIDIALISGQRSNGLGTQVIRALQEEAAADGRAMVITVQRFNVRAAALYARLGFRVATQTDLHIVMDWREEQQ